MADWLRGRPRDVAGVSNNTVQAAHIAARRPLVVGERIVRGD